MTKYTVSLNWFIVFIILFHTLVIYITDSYVTDLKYPQHDEFHFIKTIALFGEEISLNNLKHYEEMSTPLPFLLYAFWGHVFGSEIYKLRIFSIIIALLTYLLYHRLFFIIFNNGKIALLASIYLVIIPYMIALSFLIYTDMLAMLFLILCCFAIVRQNPFVFAISAACALLCRQYLSFILLAGAIFYLIKYIKGKERVALKMLISIFISFLPFLFLIFLWKGLTPENELQNLYLGEKINFHINFLIFYICLFCIYLFPIIVLTYKSYYQNVKILIASFVISSFYWLFPVTPAKSAIEAGFNTAGWFHRGLKWLFENQFYEHVVFNIAFFFGLPIVLYLFKDMFGKWRKNEFDFPFFLDIAILTFLLMMPFSYLVWEKYFLPIIPLASIRFLLCRYKGAELNLR